VRRLDFRVPIALEIPVAQIIAKNDHYIGPLPLGINGKAGKNAAEQSDDKRSHWNFHSRKQTQNRENVATKFARKQTLFDVPPNADSSIPNDFSLGILPCEFFHSDWALKNYP
jgi:hypothetical protein